MNRIRPKDYEYFFLKRPTFAPALINYVCKRKKSRLMCRGPTHAIFYDVRDIGIIILCNNKNYSVKLMIREMNCLCY